MQRYYKKVKKQASCGNSKQNFRSFNMFVFLTDIFGTKTKSRAQNVMIQVKSRTQNVIKLLKSRAKNVIFFCYSIDFHYFCIKNLHYK